MSPDIQKNYGYDPAAAGDFQKQVYEAGVTRAREIAESQAATNARNAELATQSAADVKASADRRAISGFSLSLTKAEAKALTTIRGGQTTAVTIRQPLT